MRRPTISVAMITRDEEASVFRAIKSVKPFVDEIIVADTGSIDRTPEICRSLGARVHSFAWCDDFAAARNSALEACTGDWILSLDADEELDRATGADLRKLVAANAGEMVAFGVEIRMVRDSEGAEVWSSFFGTRLFRRDPQVRWHRRVHEQVQHDAGPDAMPVFITPIVRLIHHGYREADWSAKGRDDRNLRLLRMAIEDDPSDWQAHFDLGRQYYARSRPAEAIPPFEEALRLARETGRMDDTRIATCFANLVGALAQTGNPERGVIVGTEGVRIHGEFAPLWNNLGECFRLIKRLREAAEAFARALALANRPSRYGSDSSIGGWRTLTNLGNAYQDMGELVRAIEYYTAAVQVEPNVPTPHLEKAFCLSVLGEIEMARETAAETLRLWPEHEGVQTIMAHIEAKAAQLAAAAVT